MISRGRQFAGVIYSRFCSLSTKGSLVVTLEESKVGSSIAVVSMNRFPVNSFNTSFIKELSAVVKRMESSTGVESLVIKSAIPGQFSAGLDLSEIYGQTPEHLNELWSCVQEFWLQHYSSRLATIAYINGHCLAAGILVAAACDYRLAMEGDYQLGITAARVGMIPPSWAMERIAQMVGRCKAEYNLQTGQLYSPAMALEIGLVDKLSPEFAANDQLLEVVNSYLSVSQLSRTTVKKIMRENFIKEFRQKQSDDLDNFVKFTSDKKVQKRIGDYINKMKTSKNR